MASFRADEAVVRAGHADTVELSRALIMEGRVYLNERRIDKPSDRVENVKDLIVRDKERAYVSRGGYKLKGAIDAFGIDVKGLACIDVGSSTGGFTDVMLKEGARRVYAVDVGYGLLDWTLRNDERVTVMERTNARFLEPKLFDESPRFGATDVSFISLKAVLPSAFSVMHNEGRFVALVKPQFEARKEQVGPKGIVRDKTVMIEVVLEIARFVRTVDWVAQDMAVSPIRGAEGNIEFLLDLAPFASSGPPVLEPKIIAEIDAACDKFVNSRR